MLWEYFPSLLTPDALELFQKHLKIETPDFKPVLKFSNVPCGFEQVKSREL